HLAVSPRILHLDQPRVVDHFGEIDLGRACPKWTPARHRSRTAKCRCCCCHVKPPPRRLVRPAPRKSEDGKFSPVPARQTCVCVARSIPPAPPSPSDPGLMCLCTF